MEHLTEVTFPLSALFPRLFKNHCDFAKARISSKEDFNFPDLDKKIAQNCILCVRFAFVVSDLLKGRSLSANG